MKISNLISVALAAGLISVSAGAFADHHGHQRKEGKPGPFMMFKLFDQNQDGTISADEIADASTQLKTLDVDQNGEINKADFKLMHEKRMEEGDGKWGKHECDGEHEHKYKHDKEHE